MKLVVLGATGGTGLKVIEQAIERGHSVTAFVRDPKRLKVFGRRISVVEGDLLAQPELETVIQQHDAVLSGFGPHGDGTGAWRRFALALTDAMRNTGVSRAVILSVAFLFKDLIIPPAFLFGRLFFRNTVIGASQMENVFMHSGLDWTIIRPPRLTDRPYTGRYRFREGHLPTLGFTISRADVADFMIRTAENRSSVGKIVGVCN